MSLLEQETLVNICRAIRARKVINILYENLAAGTKDWRMVEPYLVGSFPRKNMQLSAWFLPSAEQTGRGVKGDWRSYTIKNISGLEVLDVQIQKARPGFNPTGMGMKVLCFFEEADQ
jgi:predicted DNA-binding transcriptional regulator YafY